MLFRYHRIHKYLMYFEGSEAQFKAKIRVSVGQQIAVYISHGDNLKKIKTERQTQEIRPMGVFSKVFAPHSESDYSKITSHSKLIMQLGSGPKATCYFNAY